MNKALAKHIDEKIDLYKQERNKLLAQKEICHNLDWEAEKQRLSRDINWLNEIIMLLIDIDQGKATD